ncbi:MAG: hypothetical protein HC788_00220 [Sphingopyxis sp.]|nr:hypothetical protein [Sphingopyxis sp.]
MRIAAEGVTLHDPSGGSEDPAEFSEALFVAVSCSDYPKLFDIRQPAKIRRAQLETELNKALAVRPDVYAPFTFEEFRRSAFQENTVDLCIDWPQPPQDWRPLVLQNGLSKLSDLPVLVLSGEFDPLTTPVEAATVARQFPKAKHVMVRNAVHAPGVGQPSGCGGTLISQFFGGASFDQSCAQASPPARRVKRFYLNYSELLKANRPGTVPMDQLLAQIGIAAADDAIARRIFGEATGSGLRGGKVSYGPSVESGQTIKLDNVRWVTDVTVSGSINLKPDLQTAVARLNIVGPQTGVVNAVFEWPLKHDESRVRMTENREITYFNRL